MNAVLVKKSCPKVCFVKRCEEYLPYSKFCQLLHGWWTLLQSILLHFRFLRPWLRWYRCLIWITFTFKVRALLTPNLVFEVAACTRLTCGFTKLQSLSPKRVTTQSGRKSKYLFPGVEWTTYGAIPTTLLCFQFASWNLFVVVCLEAAPWAKEASLDSAV